MLFSYACLSFSIQIKSRYEETTHFSSEMRQVLQQFLQEKLWKDNTSLQKCLFCSEGLTRPGREIYDGTTVHTILTPLQDQET